MCVQPKLLIYLIFFFCASLIASRAGGGRQILRLVGEGDLRDRSANSERQPDKVAPNNGSDGEVRKR